MTFKAATLKLIQGSANVQHIHLKIRTTVLERWYFLRSKINIDYRLIQCISGFCSSPLPIFKLCLQVPRIDSKCYAMQWNWNTIMKLKYHLLNLWKLIDHARAGCITKDLIVSNNYEQVNTIIANNTSCMVSVRNMLKESGVQ